MDRCTTGWGLMLSVLLSVAVGAYRNDLSSSRHGCIWSTMEPKKGGSPTPIPPALFNPMPNYQQGLGPSVSAGGGFSLNCNLRTLSVESWNYTFSREQIEQTLSVKIKCSDKLLFDSSISANQTLFQLVNLKEVQIESCKIRKVPKRIWNSLTKLKSLVIRTQNTQWKTTSSVGLEIEPQAFEGLGQLEYLSLSENNIYESKNFLCPLRSLLKLNMSYNKLADTEDLFSSTTTSDNNCALSVQNVDLSHNSLRRVGPDAFSRMQRLTELRLEHNLIGELDDTAFEGLSQLKLLNLSSNKLVAIPPFIFKSNINIRELYLQNNSISALTSQVFSKMDQLLLLDLSKNTLTSQWIKEDIFQGLIRLVILKLNNNQLTYIDAVMFKDLISLQSLNLQNNRIETINSESFQSLSNLHLLDLSYNKISYIDGKMLSNLFVLRQLYLDHNKIRKMEDDSFKNCTSLQDLGLAGNSFDTELPVALQSLSLGLLKTLDLGECKIPRISNESFAGMSQLYGLRLTDNRITELPHGFCNAMKKLRILNLSNNRISQMSSDNVFTSCPELRVLRLDSNLIDQIPPTLAPQLSNLLWLNVSDNKIRNFNYNLLPKSVEWFSASYNSINSLSSYQSNSTQEYTNTLPMNLRVFDVSYNKISSLEENDIPNSVETFLVNYNGLKTVAPNTFSKAGRLRQVQMIGNDIENLPLASIKIPQTPSGKTLPEFYLGKNVFNCDCNMEWLTRVNQLSLLRQHPRIVDLAEIVCKTVFPQTTSIISSTNSSSTYELIPLLETKSSDFLCPYKNHCFALCECCEYDFCDCKMECPQNCSCFSDAAWSSNVVQCSSLQYEAIPPQIPMDVTTLYLDGNRLYEIRSHIFIGKKNLRTLYLNNSHVEVIKNKTFNGLKSLEVLNLQENSLTELQGYEFADLNNLRELRLDNNLLRFISPDTFANLKFLQVLTLQGNLLVDFKVWELGRNSYLNSVMLSHNPWSCDCEFLNPFRTWVASKTAVVVDFALAKCQMPTDLQLESDGGHHAIESKQLESVRPTISSMCTNSDITFNYEQTGNNEIEINNHISQMGGSAEKVAGPHPQLPPSENHNLNYSRLETDSANMLWALILCLTIFLVVIILALFFRQEIYCWFSNALLHRESGGLCSQLFCCCCPGKYSGAHHPGKISCPSTTMSDDQEKLFDAYFIYSKNEDMLLQKIIPELEDPTASCTPGHRFRLCLHYRDLCLSPESPWNREMILSACDASKRVVIVLSKNWLQSEWSSSSHFRTSIQSAIGLHQKKLIFIILPDFDQNLSTIFPEVGRNSLIKNSTVHWTNKHFWEQFKRLLPTPCPSTIPQQMLSGGDNMNMLQHGPMMQIPAHCDPSQLPYSLIMNPNLHQLQQQLLQQQQNHYHRNIIPYQIPMNRNNSLPPIPKHQIVLPVANGTLNPQQHTINSHSSLIHPIPSQLAPQHFGFGYSNETFHPQQSNHNHNHNHSHFSSHQNPHNISVIPPHSHSHSQFSNSSNMCYQQNDPQTTYNNSSSAVSSCGNDEFDVDHVYSTLDSPIQSPNFNSNKVNFSPNGGESKAGSYAKHSHVAQHSTSSGVSSGSDMTSESSNAVSPSSPIKNGILNKLNNSNNSQHGKMYFV